MTKKLALAFALLCAPAFGATVFVSQSGGSVSCFGGTQTTESVATFNGAAQTAGNTYSLCGTITTAIVVSSSGSSGNVITLQWDSAARVQVCNTTGAVQLGSHNFWLLDLGGSSTAIECPNNGTGLGTTVNAVGVSMSSPTNIEIRNGTIGPLYQYSGTGSDGLSSVSVNALAPSNIFFHGLHLLWANQGLNFSLSGTTSGNEMSFLTVDSTVGRAIAYNNGTGSGTDTGTKIHDNDLSLGDGWFSGVTDATHIEIIQTFQDGGSGTDSISGMLIYNNFFHGTSRGDSTAFIFIPDGLACPSTNSSWSGKIFNNVFQLGNTSTSAPGDGFIFTQDCHHTIEIYNNTLDAGTNGHTVQMQCMEFEGTNTVTVKNNICNNAWALINNQASGITLTASNNDYANFGTGQWIWKGVNKTTLASWQTATGQDASSFTTTPGLNSDYTITSTGSAVYQTGSNLTSLSLTALDTGAPQTFGQSGTCGTGCVGRSASVAWDLGAFPFATTSISQTMNGVVTMSGSAVIK